MRRLIDERTPPHLGSALNPVDIITRANEYVPEEDKKTRRLRMKPARPLIINEAPDTFDSPEAGEETVVLPTARERRRPLRLALARGRRIVARTLRYGTGAALLVGFPIWLWASGNIETAEGLIEREAALWKAWATEEFGLRLASVGVQGRGRTDLAELRRALGVAPGAPMLDVDVDAVRQRLESLPWVARAAVERQLPDRIVVRLVERKPIARLRAGDAIFLVDATGTVIESPADKRDGELILLSGDGAAGAAGPLLALLATHPALGERVVAAERIGERRWDLRFNNGVTARLPEGFTAEAWEKLVELHEQHALLDRPVAVLDMRLPDRLVILPAVKAAKGEG